MTYHSDDHRVDFCPWLYTEAMPDEAQRAAQREWQAQLAAEGRAVFGEKCFVSPLAGVFPDRLEMGDRCYVGAYAYLTGETRLGADCSVNPFAIVRGKVTAGDGVRIGAHAAILGFNHSFDDLNTPIFQQSLTSEGIVIGDDVWISTHVTVVDGVKIGNHSVIAAGAVVTRDVPEYSLVGGNPARVLRDRRAAASPHASLEPLAESLSQFGRRGREQWREVLRHCTGSDGRGPCYLDQPGATPSVRAWCDAVEIAALFGETPELLPNPKLIERLQSFQDAASGLFPDPWNPPDPARDEPALLADDLSRYNVLAVGYALELLGAKPLYPVHAVESMSVETLYHTLDHLPWETAAWDCGDWIDSFGTAIYLDAKCFNSQKTIEPLLGWLIAHANRFSGVWGRPKPADGWLQSVNGFYRLTRGTFAQFGLPVPYPEAAIDTILAHSRDPRYFRTDRGNACNVLDVAHGLWLCGLQTNYRRAEAQAWARNQLERAPGKWVDGRGFSFALEQGGDPKRMPSLQGTEMWLSIIFLLAELLGESEVLGYRPRGVHRLGSAWQL